MKPVNVTDGTFAEEVYNSDKPILVDFGLNGVDPV